MPTNSTAAPSLHAFPVPLERNISTEYASALVSKSGTKNRINAAHVDKIPITSCNPPHVKAAPLDNTHPLIVRVVPAQACNSEIA